MSAAETTVYLVRHGRTALNAAGVLRGRLDPPLDARGVAQAEALGIWFADTGLVAVVASPLVRARQTAAAIAGAAGARVEVDGALVDRDYGPWAGAAQDEVERRFGSLDGAPGVEPGVLFDARVTAAVVAVGQRWAPGPVAVVAHQAVNRAVLAALVGGLGVVEQIPQRTGCWNRLDHRDDHWSAPIVDARPDNSCP